MTGYMVSAKLGRAIGGEVDAMWQPRFINGADRYPIVACHGAAGDWFQWVSQSFPRMHELLTEAVQGGIPSVAAHMGGDTWGNATGTANVDTCLNAIATNSGASNDKVHLVAASMGASVALAYGIAHPTKVASMTLCIPLTSLKNFYKNNPPAGTEANAANARWDDIAVAWGVAQRTVTDAQTHSNDILDSASANFQPGDVGKLLISKAANGIPAGTTILARNSTTQVQMSAPATTTGTGRIVGIGAQLPAGADLLANAATLSDIPIRLFFAPDDTTIDSADVLAMAAAIGPSASATATDGGGHTDAGLLPTNFDFDEWVEWLIQNGG